jgi:hypothetical protein
MSDKPLADMTVSELVARFAEIGVAQDQADLCDGNEEYNVLYGQMADVSGELKSRGNDERRSLMQLYGHKSIQVRLKAAIHTLALNPVQAKQIIREISTWKWCWQCLPAGMLLRSMEEGRYKPD